MIERGRRQIRDVSFLLRICRLLDILPADLGLSGRLAAADTAAGHGEPVPAAGSWGEAAQQVVLASQDGWRSARRYLNHHRSDLAQAASRLYPPEVQVTGTPLIAAPSWLPAEPVDLGAIDMAWVPGSRQPRGDRRGAGDRVSPAAADAGKAVRALHLGDPLSRLCRCSRTGRATGCTGWRGQAGPARCGSAWPPTSTSSTSARRSARTCRSLDAQHGRQGHAHGPAVPVAHR